MISGRARVATEVPPATQVPGYAKKYDAGGFYRRIGMTGEQFATMYSVPVVIEPAGLRGH